ncbi:DUF7511 domain-containing protein [Halobacterium yunchengense]|uniref:DUF7511 domain-containing protein n=1 Tax=Halobacterium yunchengense TaxID=3108497 RepID=UPI00300931A5
MRRDSRSRDDGAREPTTSSDAVGRLACRVEDGDDGATVTLFPAGADAADLVTHWMTADADDAVSLADCR